MARMVLLLVLLAGCATDHRLQVLDEEASRQRAAVAAGTSSEEQARRLLDARTAELFGEGFTYCSLMYRRPLVPTITTEQEPPKRMRRAFPGCLVEEIEPPLPTHRVIVPPQRR